jgi:hypothetical protein
MTLDQRLTQAVRHVAEGVVVPDVDLDAVRSRAHRDRRRVVAVAFTAAIVAIAVAGTALVGGRDVSAPKRVHPVGPPQTGGPPLTPYWHDGVLHVRGIEIKTATPVGTIEVAGDTVLVSLTSTGKVPTWALVRGDRLAPLPGPGDTGAQVSVDGRIAYWETHPTADSTRFVAWDTETNRELASRDLPRRDGADAGPRLYLSGIDENGMAYWVDEASEVVVTRWDVRKDTVEPVPDLSASDMTYSEGIGEFSRDQYMSPDGTHLVFTRDAAGGPVTNCWPACELQLRVRPVGPYDPAAVVRLRLPEGTLYEHLWDPETDIGGRHMDAWWETDETVLVQATDDSNRKDLMRCSITDGACQLVFELGIDGREWRHWSFGGFPTG